MIWTMFFAPLDILAKSRALCATHPFLQGSTNVRVGSSIFGARSYPASASASAGSSAPASASRGVENSGGVVGGGQTPIEAHSSANTQNIVAWNKDVSKNMNLLSRLSKIGPELNGLIRAVYI